MLEKRKTQCSNLVDVHKRYKLYTLEIAAEIKQRVKLIGLLKKSSQMADRLRSLRYRNVGIVPQFVKPDEQNSAGLNTSSGMESKDDSNSHNDSDVMQPRWSLKPNNKYTVSDNSWFDELVKRGN